MWEDTFIRINSTLLRFFNQESPYLPTYNDIQELVALGKDESEKSLILSHLYHALDDLKANIGKYYDQERWNETPGYDWFDIEIGNYLDLFTQRDRLFEDVKKIGRPLFFSDYIDLHCKDLGNKSNSNSNYDHPSPLKNKFNTMPIKEVEDFFNVLTIKKNQKGENWMSPSDFETFIGRSFGGKSDLPKPHINIGNKGKYAIIKLFHSFYFNCYNENISPNRNKEPFLNLLKNAFSTSQFENLSNDNFKSDKSKYDWDVQDV